MILALLSSVGCWLLQIGLAVQSCAEGHVVQGAGHTVGSLVGWHALDAVFGLVWGQFAAQFVGQNVWLWTGIVQINRIFTIFKCWNSNSRLLECWNNLKTF